MNRENQMLTLVIDQGTSSTKIFLFNLKHELVYTDRIKHYLHHPTLAHYEINPLSISEACARLLKRAIKFTEEKNLTIISSGIAVQRSTFLFWDKESLQPLTPALSWQDSRAQDIVTELQHYHQQIQVKTGAPLNAHFGGPKFLHLLRKNQNLASKIAAGKVYFGPLSAFLTHSLTGTAAVDESIASRTLVMNLKNANWDPDLLTAFNMPIDCLPPLVPTNHNFGKILIDNHTLSLKCVIGDQQAALLGQGGWKTGNTAMNFGTSGSLQTNLSSNPITIAGLISSVLYSSPGNRYYLLEGTVNACNALFYWLENKFDIPHREMQWTQRCEKTTTNGIFIPGFSGLAAPYWSDKLTTIMEGYKNQDDLNEIVRSGMESIGFLVHDIWCLVKKHLADIPQRVTASGGSARKPLLQFIADLTKLEIGHLQMKDQTALGIHYLLLKSEGKEISIPDSLYDGIISPQMTEENRVRKIKRWREGLTKAGIVPIS